MNEFPWAALLGAIATLAVASIPIAVSSGRESRLDKTAKLLKTVSEAAPNSPAEGSMKEMLNLQAARAYGRAVVGGIQWWTAGLIGGLVVVILIASGLYVTSVVNAIPWIGISVISAAALIWRSVKYDAIVKNRRYVSAATSSAAVPSSAVNDPKPSSNGDMPASG